MRKPTVEERRNEILDVTRQVIVERGLGHTRVSDVAAKLGVSTSLIHYHFDSKEHLIAEAFRRAASEELAQLRRAIDGAGSAAEKLDRVFRFYTPTEAEPGWLMWIECWGEAIRVPELRGISREMDLAWKLELAAIIDEGVAAGEFTCADPHAAAWRLAALMDGLGVQVTVHGDVVSRREMLEWVRAAARAELGVGAEAPGAPALA